ncbi:MAG: tyrosine-type recombinase/integrase [bacterium]
MARIYKRGRVWYLDIRVSGRRIRKKTGHSKKIAQLALQDAIVKAEREEFGFAKKDISINKFVEQFLEYSAANHRPTTTNRYRAATDHFRAFRDARRADVQFISQVTGEVIDQYKVHRKGEWVNPNGSEVASDNDIKDYTRKGARAHTINFEIGTIRTVLNQAIKWGYLKENPTKGVRKLKVDDAKPVRFLTNGECQQLLDACPPDLYPIYFTFLNTGMRKAELEYLEWADIDLKRRKIKIRRKEDWQPKTGEREIPINSQLLKLLTELKDRNKNGLRSRYVFPHKDGSRIRTKLREKMIKIAEQAGIENLTKVHTLRHTFASHLVMSGVDLPTVKKLMGHSDIQTTMIYAHLASDHLADAVDKLEFS